MNSANKRYAMASGQLIDIQNISIYDISLEDIAHHLAKIQRFQGASPLGIRYSVGEHSINLANYFLGLGISSFAKYALLHDASEAYMNDLASPLKAIIPQYKEIEDKVQSLIIKKYLPNPKGRLAVGRADKSILLNEVQVIMPDKFNLYQNEVDFQPLFNTKIIYNESEQYIYDLFMRMCNELGIGI